MVIGLSHISHLCTLWQDFSIVTLIFYVLTFKFDDDGRLGNLPRLGSFVFHKHILENRIRSTSMCLIYL
jgi:hypothetical protein